MKTNLKDMPKYAKMIQEGCLDRLLRNTPVGTEIGLYTGLGDWDFDDKYHTGVVEYMTRLGYEYSKIPTNTERRARDWATCLESKIATIIEHGCIPVIVSGSSQCWELKMQATELLGVKLMTNEEWQEKGGDAF